MSQVSFSGPTLRQRTREMLTGERRREEGEQEERKREEEEGEVSRPFSNGRGGSGAGEQLRDSFVQEQDQQVEVEVEVTEPPRSVIKCHTGASNEEPFNNYVVMTPQLWCGGGCEGDGDI